MRKRLACLWLSLALASQLAASSAQSNGMTAMDRALQKSAIEAERRADFLETWAAASPERRSIVRALFERHAHASSSERDHPQLSLLSRGARILLGADGARIQNDPLVRLADRLDVFSSPVDLVAAEGPEDGQVITVGVRLLEPMTKEVFPDGEIRFSLSWMGPEGELLNTKSGSFGREEFNQGFPMALRTPAKASGTWRLIPTLALRGKRVRGWSIPVPFVPHFVERVTRLQQGERLMGELAYLLKWGRLWVRRCDRLGPLEWLRRMEAGQVGGTLWSPDVYLPRPEPTRPLVLLVACPRETAAELLTGPSGQAWIRAAEQGDFHLACVDARDLVGAQLAPRLAELIEHSGSQELILVARGEGAVSINLSLPLAPTPGLVGLALVNSFGAPSEKITTLPTLLVGCGGDPSRDGEHIRRVQAPGTLLLADTLLAASFSTWFSERWPH